jgi:hypothetical protein
MPKPVTLIGGAEGGLSLPDFSLSTIRTFKHTEVWRNFF